LGTEVGLAGAVRVEYLDLDRLGEPLPHDLVPRGGELFGQGVALGLGLSGLPAVLGRFPAGPAVLGRLGCLVGLLGLGLLALLRLGCLIRVIALGLVGHGGLLVGVGGLLVAGLGTHSVASQLSSAVVTRSRRSSMVRRSAWNASRHERSFARAWASSASSRLTASAWALLRSSHLRASAFQSVMLFSSRCRGPCGAARFRSVLRMRLPRAGA